MLENEQDIITSGAYTPTAEDPEHTNPFACSAWELATLKFHIHPLVSEHAVGGSATVSFRQRGRGFGHDAASEPDEFGGTVETRVVIRQLSCQHAHVVSEHAHWASLPNPRGNEVRKRVRAPTPARPANKPGNCGS